MFKNLKNLGFSKLFVTLICIDGLTDSCVGFSSLSDFFICWFSA